KVVDSILKHLNRHTFFSLLATKIGSRFRSLWRMLAERYLEFFNNEMILVRPTLYFNVSLGTKTPAQRLNEVCRSCIVRHLETSKFCPICDVQVHKAKPLHSIRTDRTLQTLAYKLVPGLYQAEMQRRRDFHTSNGSEGDMHLDPGFFSSEDSISLSLEYYERDEADVEEETDSTTQSEIEKEKHGKRHLRYLKCPAAVTMRQLKKFIRMKYGLSSEHRVDIIYEEECLRDDFSLMDVAYTFSWKRKLAGCSPKCGKSTHDELRTDSDGIWVYDTVNIADAVYVHCRIMAPMRFSYRIFNPPVYIPMPTPPVETNLVHSEHQQNLGKDQQSHQGHQNQEAPVSSSDHSPVPKTSETVETDTEDVSGPLTTTESREDPSVTNTPISDEVVPTNEPEDHVPQEEIREPPTKKVKLSSVNVDKKCKSSSIEDSAVRVESKMEIKTKTRAKVEQKRQKRKRKKSSNNDIERRNSRDKEFIIPAIENSKSSSTEEIVEESVVSSPKSEVTKINEEEDLDQTAEGDTKDKICEESVQNETSSPPEVIENDEEEEEDEEEGEAEAQLLPKNRKVLADTEELATEDNEEDFTLRLSTSEEEMPEEDTRIITKQLEVKEEKHTKDGEERKKVKGKREGRKKSKHKSKHHHQESSTRKRKAHRTEATPTILQYQEDVMKLKVKLGPLKPLVSHHRHHHHHHSKHSRKSLQEPEVPTTTINLRSNGEPSTSTSSTTSTKERLLQMRAVRHKSITNNNSSPPPITSISGKDETTSRSKKTDMIMPPSSITVSKVNIGEKRKLDSQKSNSNSGSGGEENKRPSLEIMLVNAPSPAANATASSTPSPPITTVSNSTSDSFVTVKQSALDGPSSSNKIQEHNKLRPPPPTIVRIKKTSVTSIRPPSGLTITPKLPTTTSSLPTKSSTTISKTPLPNKTSTVSDIGKQTKGDVNVQSSSGVEEDTAMRHDDIGALDLSGKSSRKSATSPTASSSFPSPSSPAMKNPVPSSSSTHQSILSIAQSLVHRQLQQQQHGLLNISSVTKIQKSPGGDSIVNAHSGAVASPVYAMSNLKTLSDTAVRIRNEMEAQVDKSRSGSAIKPQLQHKPAPISVQMNASARTNSSPTMAGRSPIPVTYASNSSPRSGASQSQSRSPSGPQQHYHVMANNSISPLRIPIPPTAL
ncbi:hypothetical protein L9F63_017654, partial [Diploptera punctata]